MTRKVTLPFDPKVFLSKVNGGRAIHGYRKDKIVFRQGDPADAVLHPEGQDQAHRRFRAGQGSGRRNSGTGSLFRRRMSEWPSAACHNGYGNRTIPDYTSPKQK